MRLHLSPQAAAALLTSAALFSSCTLNPHRVDLAYPPQTIENTRVSETSFAKPTPIAVELFEDLRRSRDVIGETRNAWMMHTGEVKASDPVADWMRRALSLELEDGNFGVTGPENTGSPPLALYGEVDVVASSKRKSTDAVVQFTVKLKRGFKILFTRAYRGVATLTPEARRLLETELGDSVDPFGEALAQALSNAAAPLASDLRAALRREAGIDN